MRRMIPLCVVTLVACARFEVPDRPVLKEYALAQKDFQLASGLRVLVQEDHTSPLVVVTAAFGVGGTSDPPGREGLAHVVEHLVFRSRPGGGPPVWDVLKRSGAAFNASTAAELTTYYAIAHRQLLPELLQLEAWRLTHTLDGVTDDVFQVEREVVRNELRQRGETTVGNRVFDELLVSLFPPGHPLARPLGGTHESLSAITLDDARRFVAAHYRPERCAVVVAGDVQADAVGGLLGKWPREALFGPGGATVRHQLPFPDPPAAPPSPRSTALRRLKGPVDQPLLLLGWSVPGGLRGHDQVLNFAGAALNIALASGIERKEGDDLRGVGAAPIALGSGSVILVQASLRPGADPEKARARILDAVSQSWSNELNQRLVRGSKWGAATSILRASGDPVASGLAVGQYLTTTGRSSLYKDSLEELAAVQPGEVLAFAARYLTRERAAAVFFEPEQGEHGGGDAGAGGRPAPAGEHEIGRSQEVNLTGMSADDIRRVAPPPGVGAFPRFRLGNGLRVVAIRRLGAPLAEVYLRLPGGDATVSPYGLASFAIRASYSGCPDHGSLGEVGGALGMGGGALATIVSARVMSGNLSNALAVMADDVACRTVSEEMFLDLPSVMKPAIERRQEAERRPQARARRAFRAALYPGHPFGLDEPDPAVLARLGRDDASAFVASHFRPGGALAVVVGDVSAEELQPLMEKYFGRWSGGGVATAAAPAVPPGPGARTIQVFDRPGATQSTLEIGCRTAPVTADTLPVFDLLEAIATEKAWDLRESWGATYGIAASVSDHPGGAADLVLRGNVETARTADAVDKLLALVAGLAGEGPDFRTFVLKRWDLAREYARNHATNAALAQAVLRSEANGWPLDLWDRYPALLADTNRAQVRDAVRPCAGHEVVTIVGDAKAVRPQLEARNLHPAP